MPGLLSRACGEEDILINEKKDKKSKYPKRTVVYRDFSEDFDGGNLKEKKIDKSYKYERKSIFSKIFALALYRVILPPIAFIYTKFFSRDRYIGKKNFRKYTKSGVFVYGNHTQAAADAFTPNMLTFPRYCHVVISSKNFSLPVLGPILPLAGGIPLPTELSAVRNFTSAIKARCERGNTVVIYPEAHLWPYCPFVRPFSSGSFDYPVKLGKPVFVMTRVYKKRMMGIGSDVYIDGPIYPDTDIPVREAAWALAERVRSVMEERLALSDVRVIEYVKAEECDTSSAGASAEAASDGE